MSQEQDQSQKTEEATPRKLLDAREKGKVITSQEVSHLAIMIGGALIAGFLGPFMAENLYLAAGGIFDKFHSINLDLGNIGNLFSDILLQLAIGLGPLVFVILVLAIFFKLIVSGLVFSGQSLIPSIERISPIKGFFRLFSLKSATEFAKGLFKIIIVASIVGAVAIPELSRVELLMQMDIATIVNEARLIILQMFVAAIFVVGFIAGLDYLYQRFEFLKQMRMTKQEVKDELKIEKDFPRDSRSRRLHGQMDKRRKQGERKGPPKSGHKKRRPDKNKSGGRKAKGRDRDSNERNNERNSEERPKHRDRRSGRHAQPGRSNGEGQQKPQRRSNSNNRRKTSKGQKHRVRTSARKSARSASQAQNQSVGGKVKAFFKGLFS